ncbi:acyl carrier protein [Pelagimonas phthalicica]|uniref:Acyl carrier protein n=1 Tax=Pelagimonas phthalicica TaxID=1037362 RepID=A0A238J6M7_9RHOB|nr:MULTISPECIES: acyl carrier protein [Roseobacteraceae]MBO9463672.1 acyl carrier protein [Tropicibacter sp. R15_0]TDS95452.1 acyl carrier protein [Pelagimonas phthalicica]SMX26025.1 acyl carrier protein [Pelagimonas phthalicica]
MTPLTLEQARAQASARQETTLKLKEALIDCLALEKEPADIPDDCLLFGVGLGLDSVDALEIVVAIESEFGLRVEDEHMKEIRSINSIVDLVISGGELQAEVA